MQGAVEGESQDSAFLGPAEGWDWSGVSMPWLPIPALDDDGCPCGAGGTTTGCGRPPCYLD